MFPVPLGMILFPEAGSAAVRTTSSTVGSPEAGRVAGSKPIEGPMWFTLSASIVASSATLTGSSGRVAKISLSGIVHVARIGTGVAGMVTAGTTAPKELVMVVWSARPGSTAVGTSGSKAPSL